MIDFILQVYYSYYP